MGGQLMFAREFQLPVLLAVLNDGLGRRPGAGLDVRMWAAAMGVPAATVKQGQQITAELVEELTARGGPAVLDIHHDPNA